MAFRLAKAYVEAAQTILGRGEAIALDHALAPLGRAQLRADNPVRPVSRGLLGEGASRRGAPSGDRADAANASDRTAGRSDVSDSDRRARGH
jgi:hypothetical protein